ncbi:MAG: DUF2569 family protein [Alphaproteobacteria bacterium]|nr:DUF2569 family protein [Alphaproteobacteria bacterium]MDE2110944.1 DUF2569 family protein [Alphaproteobacteria bacterium]MDE2495427.1 DUF2569 family protein [Alphaproteobacteria bacterium]
MAREMVDPWEDDGEIKPAIGIGGWLWLPLLHLIVEPFLISTSLMARLKPLSQPANLHALISHPLFIVLTAIIGIALLARLLFGLLCLLQLFRKRLQLPRMMVIWYGIGIAVSVLVALQFAANPDLFTQVVDPTATSGGTKFGATLVTLWSGFFIVYFDVSERVKNTFVRGDAQKGIWRGLFAPANPTVPPADPKGLRGWLLLPLLQLLATLAAFVATLVNTTARYAAVTHAEFAGHMQFFAVAAIALLGGVAVFLFGLRCLVRFFRQKRGAPRLMITWYALNIVLALLVPVQMLLDRAMLLKLTGATVGHEMLQVVLAVIINAALIAYVLRSKRVKNTFIH